MKMCYNLVMYEKIFQLQEEFFKIVANQKRLEIVQLLSDTRLSVNEMTEMLGLPQANLSQHLALMRRASLLKVTRAGTKVYYQLTDQRVAELVFSARDLLISHQQLDEATRHYFSHPKSLYPLAKDAVCGMRLSATRSSCHVEYDDHQYFFCASGCKDVFEKNPKKYAIEQSVIKEMVG